MSRLGSICTGVAAAGFLLAMQALSARAAVVESSAAGFAIQQTVHIAAPQARIYAALITPAKWWNSEHSFSGSAANLTLDARAGGCFCEVWNGGSVQHLIVVDAQPGKILRLRGALRPSQGQGVDGALTFTLKTNAGGTDLVLDDIMGGFMEGGLAKWPPLADAMLADQMARLKRFIETGSPDSAK
jgi:uncharacterized protein YndB with AHSA1/START domain